MLSQHNSQLGHRRQNSTPSGPTDPEKARLESIAHSQRPVSHRRGMSFDPKLSLQDFTTTRGPGTVNTNSRQLVQQILREAQMPGLSRPGQNEDFIFDEVIDSAATIGRPPGNTYDENERSFGDFDPFITNTGLEGRYCQPASTGPRQRPGSLDLRSCQPAPLVQQLDNRGQLHFNVAERSQLLCQEKSSALLGVPLGFGQVPEAVPMKRGSSNQESRLAKRPLSRNSTLPSPPNTAPLRPAASFSANGAHLLDVSALNMDFPAIGDSYNSSNYSPMTCRTSPTESSLQSSPELPPVKLFNDEVDGIPNFSIFPSNNLSSSPSKSQTASPKKKSQLMPEDMIIDDTGVTGEQVDAFIQGPDPDTGKFTCLFEGCSMKPFGRKENIRAHVQTHLGDRKYVCGVCNNRFVRPNDLKRHSIIHQDVKEWKCKCGAAFGRQDALRRHRIRKPFCVDGDPTLELMRKEEKKRGRPKKVAPVETAERRERKEKIRRQVMDKKKSSSGSACSSITHPSPRTDFSSPEPHGPNSFSQGGSPHNHLSYTPPASPGDISSPIFAAASWQMHAPRMAMADAESLSPPPTRGSLTASSKPENANFELDKAIDDDTTFGPCDPGFDEVTLIAEDSSQQHGSTPPDLTSSSPPPDFGTSSRSEPTSQPTTEGFDDFITVDVPKSLDDIYTLFNDPSDMSSELHKFSNACASGEADFLDESFWDRL